jgi:hypothetical protein
MRNANTPHGVLTAPPWATYTWWVWAGRIVHASLGLATFWPVALLLEVPRCLLLA